MKIGSAFPSKYLKAADLGEGKVLVTIARVASQDVGQRGQSEIKPVLYFQGKEKGLVLNKTNARTIVKLTGTDETDSWPGRQIVLYATETEFGGEMVDCIRIQAPKPNNMGQPAVPPPPVEDFNPSDDDVPF